ncbi:hypothetical protein BV22DRAFT_1043367 [Leucogyrophana mollusca]|uniref:Uncharacterized protein n=1 Tax=Leucogyrophana mollusca TaxID=85980 RepID=A0ACB8BY35_9AGAM|nr:hypothetical protein BV22DRAFT_1043367 [Leucogyrophana mollusca]
MAAGQPPLGSSTRVLIKALGNELFMHILQVDSARYSFYSRSKILYQCFADCATAPVHLYLFEILPLRFMPHAPISISLILLISLGPEPRLFRCLVPTDVPQDNTFSDLPLLQKTKGLFLWYGREGLSVAPLHTQQASPRRLQVMFYNVQTMARKGQESKS